MRTIPTRRLLVYVVAGIVVVVVGTLGLVAMRGGSDSSADGVVIAAASEAGAAGITDHGSVTAANGAIASGLPGGGISSTTSTTVAKIWVQVAGEVRDPGVYQVAADARVFEAVLEAGGFTDAADQEAIALAARLGDGCTVYVPCVGEISAGQVQTPTQSLAGITSGSGAIGSSSGSSSGLVSLNSATLEQLEGLPGIGPALAQQIITFRESEGPFASVDQLTEVPGIGTVKLEQLRPLVGL